MELFKTQKLQSLQSYANRFHHVLPCAVHLTKNSKILVTAKRKPSPFPFLDWDLGLKLWIGIWPPRACPKKKEPSPGVDNSIRSSPRYGLSTPY